MIEIQSAAMLNELPSHLKISIQQLVYDANARCQYELLSGGLAWSDEFTMTLLNELSRLGKGPIAFLFRYLWAYRTSLIEGQERQEFRHIWTEMQATFPDWPGFRPERSSPDLKERLIKEQKQMEKRIRRIERLCWGDQK